MRNQVRFKISVISITVLLLIYLICSWQFAGWRTINWDEEASLDISFGVRPAFLTDSLGFARVDLNYKDVLKKNPFSKKDYAALNTIPNVARSVLNDNSNSIAYYLQLHATIKVLGMKLRWLRMLSLIYALFSLVVFYKAAKLFYSSFESILATTFLAIHPIFFNAATLIRSYSATIFFLLLSSYALICIAQFNKLSLKYFILFAVSSSLALLSHYFSFAILFGEWIICLMIIIRANTLRAWGFYLMSMFIMALPVLAWLYFAYPEGMENLNLLNRSWDHVTKSTGYDLTMGNYINQLFNVFVNLFGFAPPRLISYPAPQLLTAGLLCLLFIKLSTYLFKKKWNRWEISVILLLFSGLIIYSIQAFVSGHFVIFVPHYLLYFLPVTAILVIMISNINQQAKYKYWISITVLVFVASNTIGNFYGRLKAAETGKTRYRDSDNRLNATMESFGYISEYINTNSADITKIVYSNWKLAQQTNYFLDFRSPFTQMVPTQTGSEPRILIYQQNGEQKSFYLKE